jgi:uncharacterized repeat protein (TIGR01451 family)
MRRRLVFRPLAAAAGTIVATAALAISAQAAAAHTSANSYIQPNLEQLPNLPVNACNNSALPKDYGTNFATPLDPNGFGYANETAIGWEGNIYAPFEYLSGSYFARGVPQTYTVGGTQYCGGMYSFGAYTWGLAPLQAPAAGSVQWNMADGYLPAMVTSFTRDDVRISITDFADKQTIAGNPAELVYTRITVTNNGTSAVDVPPGASGPNLVELDTNSDTVQPGQTVNHDFVAAVDTFTVGGTLPTVAQLTPSPAPSRRPHRREASNRGASSYDTAYQDMRTYWNQRLSVAPTLSMPNVSLPNTGGLANPGTAMDNAYKAAYIYTRIVQVENSPFSGANNYDWLLNHDLPGILSNRFELGDFTDAQNLLLTGRISEASNFNEQGANWYWDGVWRTPIAWAQYLAGTNNVAFVKQYFDDDDGGTVASQWGPSLYTMMHVDLLKEINPKTGYLRTSDDNDSSGTWVFDDETALAGLQAYAYIAGRIGDTSEATWAQSEYTSLLNATNAGLATNESASGTNFLPCEVNVPITSDRCGTANDANWASQLLWGENQWTILLQGGQLNGTLGDPTQSDNMYELGFARLDGTGVPFPSFGAYPGYSVALNTAYSADGLFGNAYRDLPITSYAWQIASTTGGPNSWWEANGSAPSPNNPWQGSHAAPEFGASPYVWTMAGQTQTLLQSLVAQGLTSSVDASGTPSYSPVVYIGRGVPDAWITPGQTISVNNLTSSYNESTGDRQTYGVRITTQTQGKSTAVHVVVSGDPPAGPLEVQLPAFADDGVSAVDGGTYDASTQTVTLNTDSATIRLGNAGRPTMSVQVASDASGTHAQPALNAGDATTATATFTNTGGSALTNVTINTSVPSGWTMQATSPTTFASVPAGATEKVSYTLTPSASANGGNGVVVSATYSNGFGPTQSVSAEQWVTAQKPLPLPPGTTDLALTATPTASYASSWTTISAINNGIYPITSNDDSDLTPYWGTWPDGGTQWIQLTWSQPITTNESEVYFADDQGGVETGAGLPLPKSWVVQYLNSSGQWVDVTGQSPATAPAADNVFNTITFDPVTTTALRVSMAADGSTNVGVGVVQWIVPSYPPSS